MATCGIKKYDNLPSRVGWIDVDYLRWALSLNNKQRNKIIDKLEKAIKKEQNN